MLFKKELKEKPLNYWEEQSIMLVIPPENNNDFIKGIFDRVKKIKNISIIETKPIEINKPGLLKVKYNNEEYIIQININKFTVPDTYINKKYHFKEEEINKMKNIDKALIISMKYKNNPKKEYYLQLKIAITMVPNLLGIIDESKEALLPYKWVKMTTDTDIEVSSNDLYNIHMVYEGDEVWLHTHGLTRCGLTELEILNSNKNNYNNHYHLINTYANYLIDNKKENSKNAYIGVLIDRTPIVVTNLIWTKALKYYKRLKLGNIKDREYTHNTKTSVIFLYKSENDEKNNIISKINEYDNLWSDNPIFFISSEETKRMKLLAQERFNYVKEEFKKKNKVLIKIGIPVKEEFGNFEHIWFELLEVKDDKFKAKLTQEPYNIENMHEGDIGWYTVSNITDWMIFENTTTITPNNVYILMK